jgi:hypothetical protein
MSRLCRAEPVGEHSGLRTSQPIPNGFLLGQQQVAVGIRCHRHRGMAKLLLEFLQGKALAPSSGLVSDHAAK